MQKQINIKMKNTEVTFTKEEVQEIIMKAFIKGEIWGETYGGWFCPTEEEKANRASKDCEKIYKEALIAKM